jgi:hypothetical protein
MGDYSVTTSAELMENYIQADFLLPQAKFLALQTDAGASLLFSIGTGGALNLTIEDVGQTHGWRQVDLGAARIKADFGGERTVKTFAAAQTVVAAGSAAEIHLAMVVGDGTKDHLYLSLGNSDSNLAWAERPVWTAAPFNAVSGDGTPITPPTPFEVVNVFLSEASDKEWIVVDTIRNPGQSGALLTRYRIDATTPAAPKWVPFDLDIDLQAAGYDSCLGRSAQAYGVDGLYTKGVVGSSSQLIYKPLVNAFDASLPPLSSRLALPGGLAAEAIAAVRKADKTSDLYVAAKNGLYWFASGNQRDNSTGVLVASSLLLSAARSLYAYAADGFVTVWGLNSNNQVFYLTCPLGRESEGAAWNVPLPILTGVDSISPFIDRNYSANTFFAHSGTGLLKVVKSPATGLWSQRRVTLPPSSTTKPATPIHSYTTHVQVNEASGQAAPNVAVTLSASNVTSVYINHLYYIVGPSPIQVTTDALGTVTIVETATTLTGTRFQISAGSSAPIPVNTMDSAWQRNAQYTTAASLRSAKIVNRDGSSRDFIPAGTSAEDLDRVAQSNRALAKAYATLADKPAPDPSGSPAPFAPAAPVNAGLSASAVADGTAVDSGDLLSWLEAGGEALIRFVEDVANDAWVMVVQIGGAVYHAVLDCVEAVVAAATWVYGAIDITVDDAIEFLQFLFDWDDILVTHKVLKNLFLCLARHAVDGIEDNKAKLAALFRELQHQINSWADIPDFNQTAQATLASNPPVAGQNSAPANLGIHHFQGGATAASSSLPEASPAEAILQDLVHLMEAEGETLAAAVEAIRTQIIEPFSTLTMTQVIKRFLAIVADTVLQSAENILVTLLDVIAQLVAGAIDALTAKLDIPILSWLYHDLTGEDLSFLDLVCLIAAIPATVIYKAVAKKAPFPSGDAFTEGLIGARNMAQIQALFVLPSPGPAPGPGPGPTPGPNLMMLSAERVAPGHVDGPAPVLDQHKLKIFGVVMGVVAAAGGAALIICGTVKHAADLVPFKIGYPKILASFICAFNIAYVSPNLATLVNARTDNWYAQLNNVLTGISIGKGLAGILAAHFENTLTDKLFAFTEMVINVVWNVPVIANIAANHHGWNTTYRSLIPESLGNFAFNFGGMVEFPIAMLPKGEVKYALVLAQDGAMLFYGAMMIVSGCLYELLPDQTH